MEIRQCLHCSNPFSGNYCNNCGEKVYNAHDKSLGHIFEEVTHFLTHFEGKFFKSLKAMFTKPGLLTYDYCRGLRKKYFKPVSFYILLVVVYLVFPLAQGLNMPLEGYKSQKYGELAQHMIAAKQERKGISYEELSHHFEKKSEKISKLLLIVILPLCSLVLIPLIRRRKEFYFFDHFILSAELNSFFLIFQFFITPLLLSLIVFITGANVLRSQVREQDWMLLTLLILTVYTTIAFSRVYQLKLWEAFYKSIIFCIVQSYIVYIIYKFLLFVTVMAMV